MAKGNPRGMKNFAHYLWGKLVFAIFDFFENDLDLAELKKIIFAPFIEEFVYRGIIFGLYRDCGYFQKHKWFCVFLLPLYFATAHMNALWLQRNSLNFKREAMIKLFQVLFT